MDEYARQNPGRYIDPTGEAIPAIIGGALFAIAILSLALELACAESWIEVARIILENATNPCKRIRICWIFGGVKGGKGGRGDRGGDGGDRGDRPSGNGGDDGGKGPEKKERN